MDQSQTNENNNQSNLSSDKIIAEALGQLSLNEREQVYEEIHGVNAVVKETPHLISSKIQQFDRELALIATKPAYDLAWEQNMSYATDTKRRICFLRATRFDPKRAAQRFVDFLKYKNEIFGPNKLTKRITLEDLGHDGLKALQKGAQQVLTTRDTSGRVVVLGQPSIWLSKFQDYQDPFSTLTKIWWYIMTSIADDEETQQNGMVYISYFGGNPPQSSRNSSSSSGDDNINDDYEELRKRLLAYNSSYAHIMPVRSTSLHVCNNSQPSTASPNPILKTAYVFDSIIKVRIRNHHGSHTECQYKLMSFGIPIRDFPIDRKGNQNLNNHLKWIDRQRKKDAYLASKSSPSSLQTNNGLYDETNDTCYAVDIPSRADVLLGRGQPSYSHPGNKHFHEIIMNHYDDYTSCVQREGKSRMAENIVCIVQEYGGRFLKLDESVSGMWMEVSTTEARNKVTHNFRRLKEADLKKKNKNTKKQVGDNAAAAATGSVTVSTTSIAASSITSSTMSSSFDDIVDSASFMAPSSLLPASPYPQPQQQRLQQQELMFPIRGDNHDNKGNINKGNNTSNNNCNSDGGRGKRIKVLDLDSGFGFEDEIFD